MCNVFSTEYVTHKLIGNLAKVLEQIQYSKSLFGIIQYKNRIRSCNCLQCWYDNLLSLILYAYVKLFAGGSLSIECLGLSLITEVYNFLPKETLFSFSHRLNFIDLMIPQQQQTLQRGPPECNLAQSFDSQIEGWFCQGRPNHLSKKIQHS